MKRALILFCALSCTGWIHALSLREAVHATRCATGSISGCSQVAIEEGKAILRQAKATATKIGIGVLGAGAVVGTGWAAKKYWDHQYTKPHSPVSQAPNQTTDPDFLFINNLENTYNNGHDYFALVTYISQHQQSLQNSPEHRKDNFKNNYYQPLIAWLNAKGLLEIRDIQLVLQNIKNTVGIK